MMNEEFDKEVDWLVKLGMSFNDAMILCSYCEVTGFSLSRGYFEMKKDEESCSEK